MLFQIALLSCCIRTLFTLMGSDLFMYYSHMFLYPTIIICYVRTFLTLSEFRARASYPAASPSVVSPPLSLLVPLAAHTVPAVEPCSTSRQPCHLRHIITPLETMVLVLGNCWTLSRRRPS